jgi:menaquinone-specific isochorismate synthase
MKRLSARREQLDGVAPSLQRTLFAAAARRGALHATEDLVVCGFGTARVIALSSGLVDSGCPSVVADALASIDLSGDDGPSGSGVVALGSLPFDDTASASLVVPSVVCTWEPGASSIVVTEIGQGAATRSPSDAIAAWATVGAAPDQLPRLVELDDGGSGVTYEAAVNTALSLLRGDDLEKVVLARSVHGRCDGAIDTAAVAAALHAADPSCALYSVPVGPGRFVGASPELIVATSGGAVSAHPLAGTVALDGVDDLSRLDWLLGSAKNRREHAVVVDDIVARLEPLCETVSAAQTPSVVRLSTDARLGTWVDGKLRGEPGAKMAMTALCALHPTPAVGGVPRATALALISRLEATPRGPWAGPVGWVDASGASTWTLGLRGLIVENNEFVAWAGAGIVSDSESGEELAETQVKLDSVLRAFPR